MLPLSPITHLLASWTLSAFTRLPRRDRHLVAWCGTLPDLDGLGAVVDLANRILGRAESAHYGTHHHLILHGLPAALLIPAVLALWGTRRLSVYVWGFLVIHFHLLCDLLGSRGPSPADIWPISYLSPLSSALTFSWPGQWALDGWPNVAFTLGLLGFVFARAATTGGSPLALVSHAADCAFVSAVQHRWKQVRAVLRLDPKR